MVTDVGGVMIARMIAVAGMMSHLTAVRETGLHAVAGALPYRSCTASTGVFPVASVNPDASSRSGTGIVPNAGIVSYVLAADIIAGAVSDARAFADAASSPDVYEAAGVCSSTGAGMDMFDIKFT